MVGLKSKSRLRRTYGYERYEPRPETIVYNDGTTRLIDLTKFSIDRQYYLLAGPIQFNSSSSSSTLPFGEYEEFTYAFSSFATGSSISFLTPFTVKPILTVEINDSTNNLQNVSFFLKNVSETSFNIEFSSQFSGSIKYRAIYSSTYPAIVERTPDMPLNYFTASAGTSLINNESSKTITYAALPEAPTSLFYSLEDTGNNLSQVALELSGNINSTTSNINISSNTVSNINFIVTK
jgi:hypothetical protein